VSLAIIDHQLGISYTSHEDKLGTQQDLALSKLLASLSVCSCDLDGSAEKIHVPWSVVAAEKSGITKLGLGFIFLKKKLCRFGGLVKHVSDLHHSLSQGATVGEIGHFNPRWS
jgi:hypothetical protein